jgi:diacylglycerol kinase family enzyme
MGFGFVTDVAKTASRFKWAADFSYVIGVFYRLVGLAFHQMVLEIDGKVISGENCFVEICNSKYTGGNMLMAPEAAIDDGLFDAVVVSPLSRASLIATFPKIFNGTHGAHPAVRFIKGKSAVVHTEPQKTLLPDGEIFGTTPTEITVLPRLAKYFV